VAKNLITGGLGYVGGNLARMLLEQGDEVVIFDVLPNAPKGSAIWDLRDNIQIIQGNLGNWAEVLEAVHSTRADTIYHLGAMITMPAEANPWAAYNTNANGTYHILEAARLFNVKTVIFPSGIATYSPPLPNVINEDVFQSAPKQMYGITKIFCERMGEYYHQKFGVNFRCVSFPAICGPGRREGLAAYASLMVHETAKGRVCRLPIDENGQMPFIYVKDVIRCLSSIKSADENRLQRRVYSIQGFSMPAKQMAEVVEKHIPGARIEFLADETIVRLAADMPKAVDDSRAREDWGWIPEYDWDRTVIDFISEINHNPDKYV
jgi:threonine 3-dehydrogenase